MSQNSSHRKALDIIANSPEIMEQMGFHKREVLSISIEQTLLSRGAVVAQPDIIFYLAGRAVVVEYKSTADPRDISTATQQIDAAIRNLKRTYEGDLSGVVVCGQIPPRKQQYRVIYYPRRP